MLTSVRSRAPLAPFGARLLSGSWSSTPPAVCVFSSLELAVRDDGNAASSTSAVNKFGEVAAEFCFSHGFPARSAEALSRSGQVTCGSAEALWALASLFERKQWRESKIAMHEPMMALQNLDDEIVLKRCESSQVLVDAVQTIYHDQNMNAAADIFEQGLLMNPYNIVALRSLQEIYLRQGQPQEALACVERTLSEWIPTMPSYPALQGLHANALFECGYMGEGERIAGQALAQEPLHGVAAVATGYGFLKSFRFRECVRLARELDYIYEENVQASSAVSGEFYYMQGLASLECAKLRPAIQHCDTILTMDNVWPESWPLAAMLLWQSTLLGATDEWIRSLDKSNPTFDLRNFFSSSSGPREASLSISDRFRTLASHPIVAQSSPETASSDPFLHLLKVIIALGARDPTRAIQLTHMCEDPVLLTICEGFTAREAGNFEEAVGHFRRTRKSWSRITGRETDTNVIAATYAECVLRAAGLDVVSENPLEQIVQPEPSMALREARAFTSQLTMRNPNSPLAWSMFSRAVSALGSGETARQARVRAQELGYRQGGSFH